MYLNDSSLSQAMAAFFREQQLLADSENTAGENIFYKSGINYELVPMEAGQHDRYTVLQRRDCLSFPADILRLSSEKEKPQFGSQLESSPTSPSSSIGLRAGQWPGFALPSSSWYWFLKTIAGYVIRRFCLRMLHVGKSITSRVPNSFTFGDLYFL